MTRPPPKPLPRILEVYAGPGGIRWVITDTGVETEPRNVQQVTMRRVGTNTAAGLKTITVSFFLTKYKLVGVFDGIDEQAQPPPPPTGREALRAWNMHRIRAERGWKLKRMARDTGIGSTFITEMERGTRAISIRTIDRLADGLKLASSAVLAELDRPAGSTAR